MMEPPGIVCVENFSVSVAVITSVSVPPKAIVSTNMQFPLPGAVMAQDSAAIKETLALTSGSKVCAPTGRSEKALFPTTRVARNKRHQNTIDTD